MTSSFTGRWTASLLLTLAAGVPLPGQAAGAPALGAYNANIRDSSISGISSGAFMAVQFATAWSSVLKGVGVIAGGPFYCAQGRTYDVVLGSFRRADNPCMTNKPALRLEPLVAAADQFAQAGDIDPLRGLQEQKVYLFSGYNDAVIAPAVTGATRDFYLHYMGEATRGNVFYQDTTGAGHAQVTSSFGGGCAANRGDFINNCGYDQAGVLLQHIYGRLNPAGTAKLSGRLESFDQSEFTAPYRPEQISLSETGYVYVPASCEEQRRCRVHIALHGCLQSAETIGDHYVTQAGYNVWADSNDLIILYPQTHPSPLLPYNPLGCWDWWGYTNAFYATRNAASVQISAIKAMLNRVTQNYRPARAEAVASDPTPGDLIATDSSDTAVALAWSSVPGATAYKVYRAVSSGDFAFVGSVAGPSFGDAGLKPATTYNYRVSAVMGRTEGAFSQAVSRSTRPTPPRCGDPGSCPLMR